MEIIDQSYQIDHFDPVEDVRRICRAAKTCTKFDIPESFADRCAFVEKLRKLDPDNPHMTPFEASSMSVIFITNRGVSHELVRHRLMSPNQESSRYCAYSHDRFNKSVTFICDSAVTEDGPLYLDWIASLRACEKEYFRRLNSGYSVDSARNALTNDVKTELYITANYREWMHIFKQRCSKGAHYQMRELMIPLLKELKEKLSCVFGDIPYYNGDRV